MYPLFPSDKNSFFDCLAPAVHGLYIYIGDVLRNDLEFSRQGIYDLILLLRIYIRHIVDDENNFELFPEHIRCLEKHQLLNTFEGAIKHEVRSIKRNYKTAIPQYYRNSYIPDSPQLQLLLPLCLTQPSKANLALAVYKIKGKGSDGSYSFYSGRTCMTLDMAINNARLFAKPDDEWLKP